MMTETGLAHAYRAGTMVAPGFSTDHAALMVAAVTLAEAAPDPQTADGYLADAKQLADLLHSHYSHDRGGYYLTSDAAEGLIVRRVAGYNLPNCLRITVGDEPACRRVAHAIGQFKAGAR